MATQIFVSPWAQSLDGSIGLFTQLGFAFASWFTDETAACLIVNDTTYVQTS